MNLEKVEEHFWRLSPRKRVQLEEKNYQYASASEGSLEGKNYSNPALF
jgi:hypothetical protein